MIANENSQSQNPDTVQRQNEYHLTAKKKIVYWLYLLLLLTFIIAISILLSIAWAPIQQFQQSDNYYYANQVTYEWKQGFINDIVITPDQTCPNGYEHAFNYQWSGTNYGCRCSPNINISLAINGICTPPLIQRNCRNMERVQNISTNYWANSSNICIKRSSVSFASQQKYNKNNKICGSSSSLVIVPTNQPCPLVNVTNKQMTLQDNYRTLDDTSHLLSTLYASFDATSPYSFYNYPLSNFTVSEYEFCLIDQDTGIDPDHSDFILLLKARGCAQPGNYTTLFTLTQQQFYSNNPSLNKISQIAGFPTPNNWAYNLGYRLLPSWKYQCRHNMDNKFIITTAIQKFNFTFSSIHQKLAIAIVVLLAILSVLLLTLILRRVTNVRVYPIGYKQVHMPRELFFALIRYIVDYACKLGIFGITFYLAYISIFNWNWFKSAINENCMDDNPQMMQYILAPYTDLYSKLIQYSVSQCCVVIVILILDTIHFVHIYRTDLKYYLLQSDSQILISGQQNNTGNKNYVDYDKQKLYKLQHHHRSQQDQENEVNDPFRITMAMQVNDDEQFVRKPKLKKKNKKIKNLFRESSIRPSMHEQQQMKAEQSSIAHKDDSNEFMLYQSSILADQSVDPTYTNSIIAPKKARKKK